MTMKPTIEEYNACRGRMNERVLNRDNKVTPEWLFEAFAIANLVGGPIVIPHFRRAVEFWDDLTSNETNL